MKSGRSAPGIPRWVWYIAIGIVSLLALSDLAGAFAEVTEAMVKSWPPDLWSVIRIAAMPAPFLFMASVSITMLIFIDRFYDMRDWLHRKINGFDHTVGQARNEIVDHFITQTKIGARLVDVGQELQLESLYRDASQISAYFPVHTLLKESARLRTILAETMHNESFRTYDMVVGDLGRERLMQTFDAWCERITDLKSQRDFATSTRERNNLIVFLKNIRVRHNGVVSEADVRMSFFHVVLSDGVKRRGVIYIWADPFGFCFDRVNGALILDGDSGYLTGLYKVFSEAWGGGQDVTADFVNHVCTKMKWRNWPQQESRTEIYDDATEIPAAGH